MSENPLASHIDPAPVLGNLGGASSRQGFETVSGKGYSGSWLPFVDTYRTLCLAPSREVTRVLMGTEQVAFLQ